MAGHPGPLFSIEAGFLPLPRAAPLTFTLPCPCHQGPQADEIQLPTADTSPPAAGRAELGKAELEGGTGWELGADDPLLLTASSRLRSVTQLLMR